MQINPSKLIAIASLAAILGQVPFIAQGKAHHDKRQYQSDSSSDEANSQSRHRRGLRSNDQAERQQADHYDPTCLYCDMPDWARTALSHKNNGGR